MVILSVVPTAVRARVPGRPPAILGNEEKRFPAPSVFLMMEVPVTVTDVQGDTILKKHGRFGVVAQQPDETIPEAVYRAQEIRLAFLQDFINHFKDLNAQIRAVGGQIILPGRRHRLILKELEKLRRIMGDDKLLAEIEAADDGGRKVRDVHARDLQEFGISPESAPMAPGVSSGLTDIDV